MSRSTDANEPNRWRNHKPDFPTGDPVAPSVVAVHRGGKLLIGEQANQAAWLHVDMCSDFAISNIQDRA